MTITWVEPDGDYAGYWTVEITHAPVTENDFWLLDRIQMLCDSANARGDNIRVLDKWADVCARNYK